MPDAFADLFGTPLGAARSPGRSAAERCETALDRAREFVAAARALRDREGQRPPTHS